jgi:Rieske Fe-S protein
VAAVSLICTHLGCIVVHDESGFHCPCHGSKFDQRGDVLGGPAPRGLRWLEVTRAPDGALVVDTKREVDAGTYFVA